MAEGADKTSMAGATSVTRPATAARGKSSAGLVAGIVMLAVLGGGGSDPNDDQTYG